MKRFINENLPFPGVFLDCWHVWGRMAGGFLRRGCRTGISGRSGSVEQRHLESCLASGDEVAFGGGT